ncbi:hypothetical protein HBI07_195680 [Parastagonospora nodorum]|nr:hypothetical protein HBI07_195680 [Parastagonospora nodorum]
MALPRELRDIVYTHLIDSLPKVINVSADRILTESFPPPTQSIIGGSTTDGLVTFLPSLAYTTSAIYHEFVPAYLRRIYLNIGTTSDFLYLENFFETLPAGDGWDKIANLTMLNFASVARTPGRATEVMDTILQATKLKVLVLSFALSDFFVPPDWPHPPTTRNEAMELQRNPPKTVDAEYMIREYQFDRLFGISELERLVVKVEHGFFEQTPRSVGVLGDLREALMRGLGEGGGVTEVTAVELDVMRPGISAFILRLRRE